MAGKESIFSTLIQRGTLPRARAFNRDLLAEIHALRAQDAMGREWSKTHYRGGYTSYASLSDLHHRTPLFDSFQEKMQPHALAFAKAQGWDLRGLVLRMNACWMNIMPRHTYHTLHLHPQSVISGAYYVRTPADSVSLRLEDPRMPYYMHAPPRRAGLYYEIAAREGTFVLFESWLRHEVPPNRSALPRVSVSFNYSIESRDA